MVRTDYHNNSLKNSQTPLKSRERAKPLQQKEEMEKGAGGREGMFLNLIYVYSCVYTKAVEAR